jgi:hypothetical protein
MNDEWSSPWWWRQYAPLKLWSTSNVITWCYNPEDSKLHTRRREKLNCHKCRDSIYLKLGHHCFLPHPFQFIIP